MVENFPILEKLKIIYIAERTLKDMKQYIRGILPFTHVHRNVIHNSQDIETAEMSING